MSFDSFLTSLFDDGRVRAAAPGPLDSAEVRAAESVLARAERDFRLEFPGEAPPFDPLAAFWGATMIYRAAQFCVYRNVDTAIMAEALTPACPAANMPSAHFSVDLTFRFLPDLAKHAKSASEHDPLLEHLRKFGARWPLSSVGMANVEPVSIDVIANHAGLLSLYVDRVLERAEKPRLADARVRAAAECAVGAFTELAGKLASELSPVEPSL
jgi:hypothetical protein